MPGLRRSLAALLLGLAAAACGDATGSNSPIDAPGDYVRTLSSGGRDRTYELHVPPGWTRSARLPIVLLFHPVPGTSRGMQLMTEFNAVADELGFLAAYPAAATGDWELGCGGCTLAEQEGVDDVGFVRAAIDQIGADAGANVLRVYVAGYSQGALLAHFLACALADRVTAFASVAATMLEPTANGCTSRRRVPALFVHGTADAEFPPGGLTAGGLTSLSLDATLEFWLARNGCTGTGTATDLPDTQADGTTVTRVTFPGCPASGEVVLYQVNGGGHTWPGAAPGTLPPALGPVSRDVDASELIGEFFARH